jgi:hypothetical protein
MESAFALGNRHIVDAGYAPAYRDGHAQFIRATRLVVAILIASVTLVGASTESQAQTPMSWLKRRGTIGAKRASDYTPSISWKVATDL